MTGTLLEVAGLEVRYGDVVALRGIDLALAPGRAVAVLGANGAGKSTLMKSIIGLRPARAGRIVFAGQRIEAMRAELRARLRIGYCPEGRRVFPGLTVAENLLVASWESAASRRGRLREMFAMFPPLAERHASPAWMLSGGQQQMLAIGRALMNRPRLLLLDEPSLGLAPKVMDAVLGGIRGIVASGTAVVLAEQNAARALSVCDDACVLRLGVVARSGPAAALAASDDIRAAFLGG